MTISCRNTITAIFCYNNSTNNDSNNYIRKLDFCLTVRHQLGKVIQMNQLDATIFKWFIPVVCDYNIKMISGSPCQTWWWPYRKGPKHVVYLLTPYTVIKCCVLTHPPDIILIFDIVDATVIYWSIRSAQPSTYPPQQQDTICCKYLSLTLLMMGKILPETCWADLIDQ